MKTIKDYFDGALTLEECDKLPTPRLLAYYKKHRWLGGIGQCECCGECLTEDDENANAIACNYLKAIKAILDKREHVEKKGK